MHCHWFTFISLCLLLSFSPYAPQVILFIRKCNFSSKYFTVNNIGGRIILVQGCKSNPFNIVPAAWLQMCTSNSRKSSAYSEIRTFSIHKWPLFLLYYLLWSACRCMCVVWFIVPASGPPFVICQAEISSYFAAVICCDCSKYREYPETLTPLRWDTWPCMGQFVY